MSEIAVARPFSAVYTILRRDGKIAFVKRLNTGWMDGYYTLLAGKIDDDEPALRAAAREAKEEGGTTVLPEDLTLVLTMHRSEKGNDKPLWIDLFFAASKWEGEPYNAEPHMHSELAWLDEKNLPDNIVPSVRAALTAIAEQRTYLEYGWPA